MGEVEISLLERAPESVIDPSLERIEALVQMLGDPHRGFPVIHLAGTNGKTSTARMIDSVLRSFGLRTGLFTSPHLRHLTERIQLSGEPISPEAFVQAFDDVAPYLALVDHRFRQSGTLGERLSMFEVLTAMAFSAFAEAPVDVAVIECGMGGTWDATNVVHPAVTVVTPIGVDHVDYLGETISSIAGEKAGILKAEVPAVFAHQVHPAAAVLMETCVQLGVRPVREGLEFGVAERVLAVGGQQIWIDGLGGRYDEIFLPLHGAHQASNAAVALAAVETFLGGGRALLNPENVRSGFAATKSPGRIEPLRSGPTVIVDAAHNPHGAQALAAAVGESFDFIRVVGVVSVMEGKDARGIIEAVEPVFDELIVTENSSPRSMLATDLGEIAASVFGEDRVTTVAALPIAVDDALERADELIVHGSVGVVVFGSVVTAADVRDYLGSDVE